MESLITIAKIILGTCLSCRVTQFFIIAEIIFLVIDGLSFFCPVIHFLGNAVIFLEVIFYLLKMLETGIFATKTKKGISFTVCLVTEFRGYEDVCDFSLQLFRNFPGYYQCCQIHTLT